MRILLIIISLFYLSFLANSQSQTILIKDAKTNEAVAFAHVMVETGKGADGLEHFLSDIEGKVKISIPQRCLIHISYMGYKTLVDSINKVAEQTILLQPDVFNLEAFVVTANCAPQKADNSIYEIKVISKKDIASKGANTLTDLLNSELNMRITNDGALGSSVSLQGLSGEHLKILVDGVPVVGRKNGNLDLSQINLYNVDHIEIIEGPMSVVYGSNALAGVINIITAENKNAEVSAQVTSYLESVGVYNFDGSFSLRKKKNYIGLAVGRNFFDGFTTTSELRNLQWNPKRQLNADLDYAYTTKKQNIKLSVSLFDELLLDKGNLLAPYYETAFDQYFYTTRISSRGDYVLKLKDSKQLSILGSYSYYDWQKNTYLKDLTTLNKVETLSPDQHDTTEVHSVMSRGIFSRENAEKILNYQLGYDINHETATGKRILENSQSIGDYAGFINLKYGGIKNLILQPGLRYGYNSKYNVPLVYSFNAHYNISNTSLRASFAKGFRAPSIKELYLDFHDVNHDINGNADLKAEYSNNVSISASQSFKKRQNTYSLKGSVYYNNIENIITLALIEDGSYTYTNLETYITKGFDVSLKYNYYPRLTINTAYGYTGIYNSTDENEANKDFLYSSNFSVNLEYVFVKSGLTLAAYYKYNGKLPQVIIDEDGQLSENFIEAYNIMDVSLTRKFWKQRLSVTIGAKNLFDNTTIASSTSSGGVHSGGSSIPIGWGRSYFIRMAYSFTKY